MRFFFTRWLRTLLQRRTILVAVQPALHAPVAAQQPALADGAVRLRAARFVH
jgi:hypothetical protein